METVTGIGGLFFRARDPAALSKWYHENLGVAPVPSDGTHSPWMQEAGPTVLSPFPVDSEYFGDATRMWMVNFRVRDLDAMVSQLKAAGIPVEVDDTAYPMGKFARLKDPEGNPIELWQPQSGDVHT